MDTPGNTCHRLVSALEILVAEEHALVCSGEIRKIRAVQDRAELIIARLAELRRDPTVSSEEFDPVRPRLAGLQARRASSIETVGARLAEMRATLSALNSARGRLGQLDNAYVPDRKSGRPMLTRLSLSA